MKFTILRFGPRCAFALALIASPVLAGTVSGHVRDQNGTGVSGVDLDFFDATTGVKLATPNDNSGTGGSFSVVVPNGTYRVTFDPTVVPGSKLAPKQILTVVVNGNINLGNVVLKPGVTVSGKVTGPDSAPVANADIDLIDPVTGIKAFTPDDNTNAQGNFSFVTESGTFVLDVEPPTSTKLLAFRTSPINMTADTQAGTIPLTAGFALSGTVTSGGGLPLGGVDLDVFNTSTASTVLLGNDTTNTSGFYNIIVPAGTLNVTFNPPSGSAFSTKVVNGVMIQQDATLDVSLSSNAGADPVPNLLNPGDTLLGSLQSSVEVDEARFTAVAGQLVTLDARRISGSAVPAFEWIAPSGAAVNTAGIAVISSTGMKITKVSAPESGTHRLLIFARTGTQGTYRAKVSIMTPVSLKTIKLAGVLSAPADVAEFAFVAPAGSGVKGSVSPAKGSTLKPGSDFILAPDASALPVSGGAVLPNGKFNLPVAGIALSQTGIYTFRVISTGGTTGAFTGLLKLTFPTFKPAQVPEI